MTEEKTTEETAAPSPFTAVPLSELPQATIGATPESIALGKALLAIVSKTVAARDSVVNAERKDALNRASVIKRAVAAAGGTPKGTRLSLRTLAGDDGYRVAALLVDAK